MTDIFLSYARSDRERVRLIVETLESAGWTVWWDRKIAPGVDFDDEISRHLKAAKCVVVVWSRDSVDSRWVRGEARTGLDRSVAVPVRLDRIDPPIDFRSVQTIDLHDGVDESEGLRSLVASVGVITGETRAWSGLRRSTGWWRKHRRELKFAGAVALALIVGAALFNWKSVSSAVASTRFVSAYWDTAGAMGSGVGSHLSSARELLRRTVSDSYAADLEHNFSNAGAWGAAQMVASLGRDSVDVPRVGAYFDGSFDRSCSCWAAAEEGLHAGATAWVILAHVAIGKPLPQEAIARILARQFDNGAWPIYFDAEADEFSSTYATALLTLALDGYAKSPMADAATKVQLRAAVERAVGWLHAHFPQRGLWVDYPDSKQLPLSSRSLSAFVVFVLLKVEPTDPRTAIAFDRWAKQLATPTAVDYVETSGVNVSVASGKIRRDATRQIVLAWETATLVAGYDRLSGGQRVSARGFLDRALRDVPVASRQNQEYIYAETLYAFDHAAK